MINNNDKCEAMTRNKTRCVNKAKYITAKDNLKVCGIHKDKEVAKKEVNIIEEINSFDLLYLPNEIICEIVDCCDLKSKITLSLCSHEMGDMFPEWKNCTQQRLIEYISINYNCIYLLLSTATRFNIITHLSSKLCKKIVENNKEYDVVNYFVEREKTGNTIKQLIGRNTHVDVVRKILFAHPEIMNRVMFQASKYNNVAVVTMIVNSHLYHGELGLFYEVCDNGNLTSLIPFIETGVLWDNRISIVAARRGYLDYIIYANENKFPIPKECMLLAVKKGHLECVKYLYIEVFNKINISKNLCTIAARNGQLQCLMYLHEQGNKWSTATFLAAIDNQKLECLIYLHENGCPWRNKKTHKTTLTNCNNPCWKYLVDNNCV